MDSQQTTSRDMALAWLDAHLKEMKALVSGNAAVIPFSLPDGKEQMGILYGRLGYNSVRVSFQEARLDK